MDYRHRHFVVFPLFVLLLTLSSTGIDFPVQAEVRDPIEYTMLFEGSQRFDARDLLYIDVGGIDLAIFDGSAHVVHNDDTVTVSALTSPVAILEDEKRIIVPIGIQWSNSDRALRLLPQSFIERHLREAPYSEGHALTLSELEQRMDDEAFWMVTSLHPRYRDLAWVAATPDVSLESQLTRALVYPRSLDTYAEYSDFAFDRYRMSVTDLLSNVSKPETVIEQLLDANVDTVQTLYDRGYPKRGLMLSQFFSELVDTVLEPTEEMRDALREMNEVSQVIVEEVVIEDDSEDASSFAKATEDKEEVEVLQPEQVEALADRLLSEAGALFTKETTITALQQNKASIENIIFGGSMVDRSASFTFDVGTYTVSDIIVNGETGFPYQPQFEDFVTWMKR